MLYGRENINQPSRFINEIDEQYIEEAENSVKEIKKIHRESMYTNDDTQYKNGDIVEHDTYGKGVVINCDKMIVTVAFNNNIGVKKLMKNHKSLKKVATY